MNNIQEAPKIVDIIAILVLIKVEFNGEKIVIVWDRLLINFI